MKRRFAPFAALMALLTSGAAYAADLAVPAPAPAAIVAPVASVPFSGLYVGAMLGHAAGTISDGEGFKFPREGYTVAGAIGYNHRLPGIVVGGELDAGITDISGSTSAGGFTVKGSSKYLGSARARVGLPIGQTLVYGTGGLALTNAKLTAAGLGSDERDTQGYVLGAASTR